MPILRLFFLPFGLLFLFLGLLKQRLFIRKTLQKDVNSFLKEYPNSMQKSEVFKIINYYPLLVTGFLGNIFCFLRGKSMTKKERFSSTYQCAHVSLVDDFYDKELMDIEELAEIVFNKKEKPADVPQMKLFYVFAYKMIENEGVYERIIPYLNDVLESQKQSLKQKNELSFHDLCEVTAYKGWASLVYLRSVFNHRIEAEELNFLKKFGFLMQLSNDIFDVHKDKTEGIKTIANTSINIYEVEKLYLSTLQQMIDNLKVTDFSAFRKFVIKEVILLFYSMPLVALQKLKSLQDKNNGVFELEKFTRQDLVCDMRKVRNVFRWIGFYVLR